MPPRLIPLAVVLVSPDRPNAVVSKYNSNLPFTRAADTPVGGVALIAVTSAARLALPVKLLPLTINV